MAVSLFARAMQVLLALVALRFYLVSMETRFHSTDLSNWIGTAFACFSCSIFFWKRNQLGARSAHTIGSIGKLLLVVGVLILLFLAGSVGFVVLLVASGWRPH